MQSKTIQARVPAYNHVTPDDAQDAVHPVISRILANRNIDPHSGLQHSLKSLLPPDGFKDIDIAAERIVLAIGLQQRVLIVGDYDADGATSTALAIKGLRSMGLTQIRYTVPNRFSYGYGLSLKLAKDIGATPPDLVITVDNGISSIEGVACLNELGVDVIVTDHHLSGEHLPAAVAIVNPNQPGCEFADKSIAGVGVMFYLLLAVNKILQQSDYSQQKDTADLLSLLDLVALGTVADVVSLGRNNRILVAQGIARMRAGRLCAGIAAILKVGKREPQALVAQDLGFVVGPRLNAAGRLEDISSGIECLLATDPLEADRLAQKLDEINRARKEIEQAMQTQALAVVKNLQIEGRSLSAGLVLFDASWHEGVVGLVASRIKEKSGLPVLVFAPDDAGEFLKGSARSIPQVHIRDVLANIDARQPKLIERFGGHAMAAGLSIRPEHLDEFRAAFVEEVAKALLECPPDNTILTDGELSNEELNRSFAEKIRALLPWGQACPEPEFEGEFEVINSRFVGEIHLKLVLCLFGARDPIDAICFRYLDSGDAEDRRTALNLKKIRAVYSLDVNHFRGKKSLQLIVRYLEAA